MKFPRSIEVDLDQFILKYGNMGTNFFYQEQTEFMRKLIICRNILSLSKSNGIYFTVLPDSSLGK